ncbi:MAG: penicillin acylase family protein [Anaerolineae bacterium]|nr:penicillin acylase family protein [Anaerolineae bacterium]
MRIWHRTLVGIGATVLVALLGLFIHLRGTLPKVSGTVTVDALDGHVEVVRDQDGVPHIFAASDHDAFYALGYVHAQDRLWQMEMQRRIGAGRLSEVLGGAALDTDKFLRTLGTYRAAVEAWPALAPKSQAALVAYAAGVNAWLDGRHSLPIEFTLLGFKPEPWTVYDSLVWAKMMAWDLGGNYSEELLRAQLAQAVGPERAGELLPPYPADGTTILAAAQVAPRVAEALLSLGAHLESSLQLGGVHVGSNNWVISGTRTESGLPLLANDPHLGAQIPSIWYLAELQGGDLHVVGATLPGLPSVVIGHNEHIAWGVTNLVPDVQDLYVERINPENPNQYQVSGEWVDMTVLSEPIYVKGRSEPIPWAARSTRHGPLISDVSGKAPSPVALRWTALDPGDTTMDSFLQVNYASDWDEFVHAMRSYVAPSQNFVYADREGNIGYFGPGHIPIRDKGDGTLPIPGWDGEYEWSAWIPFEELPQAFNPEAGYIATANNRVVDDDYPYHIGSDWAPPYRAQRISELIEEKSAGDERISVQDVMDIQADQRSAQVSELLPLLLQVEPADDRQARALEVLQGWDGTSSADSVPAAIYESWLMYLGRVVFEDDLHGDLYQDLANRHHATFLFNITAQPDNPWCDNLLTTPQEGCVDAARAALERALDDLEERAGKKMSGWNWGRFHRTQYPHNPLSQVRALRAFFHRQIANGGNTHTVNVAPVRYTEAYSQYHVPSYRQIVDLSDLANSAYMHTTGQSGNPLSAHYDDLIKRHQAVEYLPMTFGRVTVSGDTLVLKPR